MAQIREHRLALQRQLSDHHTGTSQGSVAGSGNDGIEQTKEESGGGEEGDKATGRRNLAAANTNGTTLYSHSGDDDRPIRPALTAHTAAPQVSFSSRQRHTHDPQQQELHLDKKELMANDSTPPATAPTSASFAGSSKRHITPRPFLRKGEGLARFRMGPSARRTSTESAGGRAPEPAEGNEGRYSRADGGALDVSPDAGNRPSRTKIAHSEKSPQSAQPLADVGDHKKPSPQVFTQSSRRIVSVVSDNVRPAMRSMQAPSTPVIIHDFRSGSGSGRVEMAPSHAQDSMDEGAESDTSSAWDRKQDRERREVEEFRLLELQARELPPQPGLQPRLSPMHTDILRWGSEDVREERKVRVVQSWSRSKPGSAHEIPDVGDENGEDKFAFDAAAVRGGSVRTHAYSRGQQDWRGDHDFDVHNAQAVAISDDNGKHAYTGMDDLLYRSETESRSDDATPVPSWEDDFDDKRSWTDAVVSVSATSHIRDPSPHRIAAGYQSGARSFTSASDSRFSSAAEQPPPRSQLVERLFGQGGGQKISNNGSRGNASTSGGRLSDGERDPSTKRSSVSTPNGIVAIASSSDGQELQGRLAQAEREITRLKAAVAQKDTHLREMQSQLAARNKSEEQQRVEFEKYKEEETRKLRRERQVFETYRNAAKDRPDKKVNQFLCPSMHECIHTHTHIYIYIYRQTDRQTGRQAGRHADRQTYIHTCTFTLAVLSVLLSSTI